LIIENINKIIRLIIKYAIIFVIFIMIIVVSVYMFFSLNDLHLKGWNEFEQGLQKEYLSIKDLEIHSNERCIFVSCNLNKTMELMDATDIFDETKKYLLSEEVFLDIEKYQNKKYPNDFYEIYIRFYDEKDNKKLLYEFSSARQDKSNKGDEDFKVWYIYTPENHDAILVNP
jgi:hypothetical protein